MKYLRRFNEELNPSTYRNAAKKLRKLGHEPRAKELEQWSKKRQSDDNIERWKEEIDTYSKFGKFKLNIINPSTGEVLKEDFHLCLVMDRMAFHDDLDIIRDDKKGQFVFMVGLIPATEEALKKCLSVLPDCDMEDNGFFWGMIFVLDFTIDNVLKLNKFSIGGFDESTSGQVSFADRQSANRLKTLLKRMFSDPNLNYPSGYNDITNFYDMVVNIFGAEYGLSSDYGFEPEQVSKFMNTVRPNEIYKTI